MTTKSVRGVKLTIGKDGKTKLVRVTPFRARIKAHKTDRLVKAWQKKRPPAEAEGR